MSKNQENPEPLGTAAGFGNVNSLPAIDARKSGIPYNAYQVRRVIRRHGLSSRYAALVAALGYGEPGL